MQGNPKASKLFLTPQPHKHISSNMAKKLVMEVHMGCDKSRSKALKVAAGADGVNFVGFEGEGKNKVVVIGDGVDAAKLAKCMRKKFGRADIVSLADVQ